MRTTDTHQFSFYTDVVEQMYRKSTLDTFELADPELVHRITVIVRLTKGDQLILFNAQYHVNVTIVSIDSKRALLLQITSIEPNRQLLPTIQWLLPLLKKEAFEDALYTLTELGVSSIQPLITHKTTRFWGGEKEIVRSRKILIAAAEQSKQFVIPHIHPIITLDLWLLQSHSTQATKVFFDPQGRDLRTVLTLIEQAKSNEIIAFAGPEGDLTADEKMLIADKGFTFTALTPTILRAQQAIAVGLGALRSLLDNERLRSS